MPCVLQVFVEHGEGVGGSDHANISGVTMPMA